MKSIDNKESTTPRSQGVPSPKHMFEPSVSVQPEHLITESNQKVYAFNHDQKHLSLKQRFKSLSRARQVVIAASTVSVTFIIAIVVLSVAMYTPPHKSSTLIATKSSAVNADLNGDGLIDTEDDKIAAGDANKDGVIDGKDLDFIEADLNGDGVIDENDVASVSDEDISWWQKLLSNVKGTDEEDSDEIATDYEEEWTDETTDDTEAEYEDVTEEDSEAIDADSEVTEEDTVVSSADDTSATESDSVPVVTVDNTPVTGNASSSTYTIATWNVHGSNKQNVGSRAKDILKNAQILGLQEVHGSTKMNQIKSVACSSCDYEYYMPSAGDSYPIVWQKSLFKKVDQGSSYMSSPPGLAKRYAVWVKLQNRKTGKYSFVINTHLAPKVESKGNSTNSKYTSSYKTHMNNLVAFVKTKKSANIPLFITGDFNVTVRKDCKVSFFPCKSLAQGQGIVSGWALTSPKYKGVSSSQGTHSSGNRLIDYVMAWKRSDVTANTSSVIGGNSNGWGGSDHKPSLLNVTVR